MKQILFLLLFTLPYCLNGQTSTIDSLNREIKRASEDSVKVKLLNRLSTEWKMESNYKQAFIYAEKALKLANKIGFDKGKSPIYVTIAMIYFEQGQSAESIEYYTKALQLQESLEDKLGMAKISLNVGIVYHNQGDLVKALGYYHQSLKLFEKLENKGGVSSCLNSIGIVYDDQKDFNKALDYYHKSLKLDEELGDKNGIAATLGNIGNIYSDLGQQDKALEYQLRSLKLREESGNVGGIGNSLLNIGVIYQIKEEYDKALTYYHRGIKLYEQIDDKSNIGYGYSKAGEVYLYKGNIQKAQEYAEKSLKLAREVGYPYDIQIAAKLSSDVYKQQGRGVEALEMYELFIQMRDSIKNEEVQAAAIQKEMQYGFDKKQLADSLKVVDERTRTEMRFQQEKSFRYFLYGGLGIVLLFAGFIYNRFKLTQQQKTVIEQQKQLVEHKNLEITDSINYAKRIQNAILPSERIVNESLNEHFILYKPKDIVAGDFYWVERQNEKTMFAVADCTGHGVPGAMVSVVCHNALNRSVREFGLSNPGQILDKTREIVIREFEKSDDEVKDGMDISLCVLDGNTIHWAGANNPLWVVHSNGHLTELKPDKQPIGIYPNPVPFTSHSLQLQSGDVVYLFTDGYQDQFGGAKEKKFKISQLRDLVLSIHGKTMAEQKAIIDDTFEQWKGALEQIDDVCVLGVRLKRTNQNG